MDYPFDTSFLTAPDPAIFSNFGGTTNTYNATDKTVDISTISGGHGGFLLGSTPAVPNLTFGAEIMLASNYSGFTDNLFGIWLAPSFASSPRAAYRIGNRFSAAVNGWYVMRTVDGGATLSMTPIRQGGNGVPAFALNTWYDMRVEYSRLPFQTQGSSILRFYVNDVLVQELEEFGTYSTDMIPGIAVYSGNVKVRRIYGNTAPAVAARPPAYKTEDAKEHSFHLDPIPVSAQINKVVDRRINFYKPEDMTIRGRVLDDSFQPSVELIFAVDNSTVQPVARVSSRADGFFEIPGMDSRASYSVMTRRDGKMQTLPTADYTGFGELAGTYRIRGQNIGAVEVHVHSEQTGEYLGRVMTDSNGQFRIPNINANHLFALVFREPSGAWEDRVSSRRIPELSGYTLTYSSTLHDEGDRIAGTIKILDGYGPFSASVENAKPGVGVGVIGNEVSFFGETTMMGPYSIPVTVKSEDGGSVVVPVEGIAGYMRGTVTDGAWVEPIDLEAQIDRFDPYFTSVRTLLHFDPDTVSGSSAIDKSSFALPWVIPAGVAIDNTDSRFGGSMKFTSSIRGIYTTNTELLPGTGDFTIEMWIKSDTSVTTNQILFNMLGSNGWNAYVYIQSTSKGVAFYSDGYGQITSGSAENPIENNVWTHIAVCRSEGSTRIYQNGVMTNSGNRSWDTGATGAPAWRMAIGGYGTDGAAPIAFRGNIDEFRYTRGVARYTENFTRPTKPYLNQ